jgi:hypothetical protein
MNMSRSSFIGVAAIAFTLLTSTARGGANLVVNGSFETPTVPVGGYNNFPGGSTAITGWTVVGVDSSVGSTAFTQSGIAFHAQQGNQFLDTAGVTSNSSTSGVSQNVPTAAGATYILSFYVGSATDHNFFYPSTVDLRIDGGPRVSYTNPNAPTDQLNWMQFTVTFTATGATATLTFLNGSASYNYESLLDNVTLEAAPACGPADLAGQGGIAGADGMLDNNDFIVFIDYFFAHSPIADRGSTGGVPGADGHWDNNDFVVFIDQFFGGCV